MKTFFRSAALLLLVLLPAGCVWHDGRVHLYGGAEVYYGPFRCWFHDGPWLDGVGWWHGGYRPVLPPRHLGAPQWPRGPTQPRPRIGPGPRR